jgi:hypothetical protein
MRALLVVSGTTVLAITAIAATSARPAASPDGPAARHVVLAELFTSEGCSSCPPADALLQRISTESPIEGVEILGLEEHVDYWDNLGWRDPFSSAAFTRRQSDYADRVFRSTDIYTPQIVIDGAFQAVGSDAASVRSAIARAARQPGATLRLTVSTSENRAHAELAVDVPPTLKRHGSAGVFVALVEDGLTSHVDRGENRGRTLPHIGVVRSLTRIGALGAGASSGSLSADLPLAPGWQPSQLRAVAFLQDHDTLRVLGSASSPLSSKAP